MELVKIDIVGLQVFQGLFELFTNLICAPELVALEEPIVMMTEFGGQKPLSPIPGDSPAHQTFRNTVAVAFSCIDEVYPGFPAAVENSVDFFLGVVLSPFAAELPCAEADNRNPDVLS